MIFRIISLFIFLILLSCVNRNQPQSLKVSSSKKIQEHIQFLKQDNFNGEKEVRIHFKGPQRNYSFIVDSSVFGEILPDQDQIFFINYYMNGLDYCLIEVYREYWDSPEVFKAGSPISCDKF